MSDQKKSLFEALALDLGPLKSSHDYRLLFIGQFAVDWSGIEAQSSY
jgi:hypothetical protein